MYGLGLVGRVGGVSSCGIHVCVSKKPFPYSHCCCSNVWRQYLSSSLDLVGLRASLLYGTDVLFSLLWSVTDAVMFRHRLRILILLFPSFLFSQCCKSHIASSLQSQGTTLVR